MKKKFIIWIFAILCIGIQIVYAQAAGIGEFLSASWLSIVVAILVSASAAFAIFRSLKLRAFNIKYNLVGIIAEALERVSSAFDKWNQDRMEKKLHRLKQAKAQLLEVYEQEKKNSRDLDRRGLQELESARKTEAGRERQIQREKKAEEAKKRKREEEKPGKKRVLEIEAIRNNLFSALHGLGLYKTPEERRRIQLQKERERREKLKRVGEQKKQREAEELKLKLQRKRELNRQQREEKRLKLEKEEEERKVILEEKKREAERKRQEEEKLLEQKRETELTKKKKYEEELKIKQERDEDRKAKLLSEEKNAVEKGKTKTEDKKEQKSGVSLFKMFSKAPVKDESSFNQWPGSDSNEDILKRSRIAVELGKKLCAKDGKFKISDVLESITEHYKIDKKIIKQIEFEIKTHIVQSHEFETFTEYGNVYFRSKKKS